TADVALEAPRQSAQIATLAQTPQDLGEPRWDEANAGRSVPEARFRVRGGKRGLDPGPLDRGKLADQQLDERDQVGDAAIEGPRSFIGDGEGLKPGVSAGTHRDDRCA